MPIGMTAIPSTQYGSAVRRVGVQQQMEEDEMDEAEEFEEQDEFEDAGSKE